MKKDKKWLYISILSLIMALVWVGLSAIKHLQKSTISPDVEKVMIPLDPTIDRATLVDLSKRKGATP